MNDIIERLIKYKKDSEYICLVSQSPANQYFCDSELNWTKTGELEDTAIYDIDDPLSSNYISLNAISRPGFYRDSVTSLNGFLFDFDEGDIPALVARVENLLGTPTFKTLSTPSLGRTQLVYLFDGREERLDLWEKISYSLIVWADSDWRTWNATRIIRNPYSINSKTGERCELLEFSGVSNPMEFFLEKIESEGIKLRISPNKTDLEMKRWQEPLIDYKSGEGIYIKSMTITEEGYDEVLQFCKCNNWTLTATTLTEEGLSRYTIIKD